MSRKTIDDLRDHLFAAIQGVRDGSVSIEQARTISELSQVVVNTAKVGVDFVRATDRRESVFLSAPNQVVEPQKLPNGIVSIRRHVLGDD